MNKTCAHCRSQKPLDAFNRDRGKKDGRNAHCRECSKALKRKYYEENTEHMKAKSSEWRKNNPVRFRKQHADWYERNREHARAKSKKRYRANAEIIKEKARRWREDNLEYAKERNREYARRNRESRNAKNREAYANEVQFRLLVTMRGMIARTLRGHKSRRTVQYLGYAPEQLRQRIEMQFTDGMSWGNYGEWHIDHTKPVSRFFRQGEYRPEIINALSNLRPMWARDNYRKNDSFGEAA